MINATQHLLFLLCKLECNAGYLLFFLLRVVLYKVHCAHFIGSRLKTTK
jgi:hypothetical protein